MSLTPDPSGQHKPKVAQTFGGPFTPKVCYTCVAHKSNRFTNPCLRARTCNIFDLHNLHKSKICVCFTNLRFVCKLTQIEDLCHTNCPVGARVFASICVAIVPKFCSAKLKQSACTYVHARNPICVCNYGA